MPYNKPLKSLTDVNEALQALMNQGRAGLPTGAQVQEQIFQLARAVSGFVAIVAERERAALEQVVFLHEKIARMEHDAQAQKESFLEQFDQAIASHEKRRFAQAQIKRGPDEMKRGITQ